jgi:hypothetical protein
MSKLLTDGDIPVDLSAFLPKPDAKTAAEVASSCGVEFQPPLLRPAITVAELANPTHPPITVATVASCQQAVTGRQSPAGDSQQAVTGRPQPPSGQRPYFDDLLKLNVPWITVGGSLMGWSKLKTAKYCLRQFFWEYLMGVELRPKVHTDDDAASTSKRPKKVKISPLHLGSLVHACIEGFYRTGGMVGVEQPLNAVKVYYPEVALEARRLVSFYLEKFNTDERQTWDVRCVERESRYYYAPRKCGGKRRSLCISSRVDGAYRKIKPGMPRLAPGQVAVDALRLHELKSTGTLYYSRLRGFYMNAQLNLQLLSWNHGHAVQAQTGTVLKASNADLVGPTSIVTVTHIGKDKAQDPDTDIDRSHYMIPDDRLAAFEAEIGDWYYDEIGERLFSPHWADPATWRRDWTCSDRHYQAWNCPYLSICEAGQVDQTIYQRRAGRGMTPDMVELPKELAKATSARRKTAAEVDGK